MNYNSQFGEDRFLVEELGMPKKGFFLDFGAGDPIRLSNTYYFEQMGWDGICIEGDPRNFEALFAKRKTCVFGVIDSYSGLIDFNISGHGPDLSSVKYEEEAKKITTACFTVGDLFQKFKIPRRVDLVSIDVEGNELVILEPLLQHCRPQVIIVEYDDDEKESSEVSRFFFNKLPQYDLVLKNQANLIYKNNGK